MRIKTGVWMLVVVFIFTGLIGCRQAHKQGSKNPPPANAPVKPKSTNKNQPACSECLAGLVVPSKDIQVIEDTSYTEVVSLDASKWDVSKLPPKVIELQGKGYACSPTLPKEEVAAQTSKDPKSKPVVKMVKWECKQLYHDYRNLQAGEMDKKVSLEKQGFTCQKSNCINERDEDSYTWFCSK